MSLYSFENLTKIINQSVLVKDEQNNQVSLLVQSVKEGSLNDEEWASFSVFYEGSDEFHLPQGNYHFEHEIFGSIKLLSCPRSETTYETTISRKRTDG